MYFGEWNLTAQSIFSNSFSLHLFMYPHTNTNTDVCVNVSLSLCVCACWMYTKRTTLNVIRELNKSYIAFQYESNIVFHPMYAAAAAADSIFMYMVSIYNAIILSSIPSTLSRSFTYKPNRKIRQQFFHRWLKCEAYTRGKLPLSLSCARFNAHTTYPLHASMPHVRVCWWKHIFQQNFVYQIISFYT